MSYSIDWPLEIAAQVSKCLGTPPPPPPPPLPGLPCLADHMHSNMEAAPRLMLTETIRPVLWL